MVNPNIFYTYAYLREDRTPYYIGKGKGKRAYQKNRHRVKVPDKNKIIFLKQNLTEEEAHNHEIYMIFVLGRKDLETGILRNLSDGGEGCSGYKHNNQTKQKMKDNHKGTRGYNHSEETKQIMSEKRKQYTGITHPCYGRIFSHTQQSKDKISKTLKGRVPWNKGKKLSEETKEKMKQSALKRKVDKSFGEML